MEGPLQYVTNETGEKTAVLLAIKDYETLMEDLHDLAGMADRRDEETIPHEQFLAELKVELPWLKAKFISA